MRNKFIIKLFIILVSTTTQLAWGLDKSSPSEKDPVEISENFLIQENYQEALPVILAYLNDHPKDPDALLVAGKVYEGLENFGDSYKYIKEAVKIGFSEPLRQASLLMEYGDVLAKLGRFSDAVKQYDAAIALDSKDSYMAIRHSVRNLVLMYGAEYAKTVLKDLRVCEINFMNRNINHSTIGQLIASVRKMKMNGCTELVINIMTKGGSIEQAVAAYNFLRRTGMKIITNNLSETQSAGLILYCSGDVRYADENSYFMYHSLSFNFSNNIETNLTSYMKVAREQFFATLKKCMPENIFSESVSGGRLEYYFDKEEAVRIGLVNNTEPLVYLPDYSDSYYDSN